MDKSRNITNKDGNITGANQGNDSEIHTENTNQGINYLNDVREGDLENLKQQIVSETSSEREQEETLHHYENLKTALEQHDKEKAEKYWGWIKDSVGLVSSLSVIGSTLGFM